MRNRQALPPPLLSGEDGGAWVVRSQIDGTPLRIIASWGDGWDHVSVSRDKRCPNWLEMEQVARLFFKDDETAMQLHIPLADHINAHPFCLHWWRPHKGEIPRPPAIMLAPPGVTKPLLK